MSDSPRGLAGQSPSGGSASTIPTAQCAGFSNSFSQNIANHVNQIRKENAGLARGAGGVRGKAQIPNVVAAANLTSNAQELLREFRVGLANTTRLQTELKQLYDEYVEKSGELDSSLSAAAMSSQEWSGVGVVVVQLSRYHEQSHQLVFVMGGRRQCAIQQVHTLTISLVSPHLAGSDKICVSTFVYQTHIQHHRVSCVYACMCVCVCVCMCVCVYVCVCVCAMPCQLTAL